jgi:hypothetical protein
MVMPGEKFQLAKAQGIRDLKMVESTVLLKA